MEKLKYLELKESILVKLKKNLSPDLKYHSFEHTLYVLQAAEMIAEAEKIKHEELCLLRIAVLFHDAGFMVSYNQHEMHSCEIAKNDLKPYNLGSEAIEKICGMIMATQIPQTPKSKLEEIIADADLEYLGTELFNDISGNLYRELNIQNPQLSINDWNKIQVKFLENHHFFTRFCIKNREPLKQKHLAYLRTIIIDE